MRRERRRMQAAQQRVVRVNSRKARKRKLQQKRQIENLASDTLHILALLMDILVWTPLRWIVAVVPGIIIYFALQHLFYLGMGQNKYSDWLTWGALALTYIPIILPHAIVTVPPGEAHLYNNNALPEWKRPLISALGFQPLRSQREYSTGWHIKFYWETFYTKIDLKRIIIVDSGDEGAKDEKGKMQRYSLKSGRSIKIRWQIQCTPLRGYLVNFYRTKEEDIKRLIKIRAEENLQGSIGEMDKIGYGKKTMIMLRRLFEKTFRGPLFIDPLERQLGVWTGTPEIFKLSLVDAAQEGVDFEQEMEFVANAANNFRNKIGKDELTGKDALFLTVQLKAAASGEKMDWVNLVGNMGGFGGSRQNPRNRANNNNAGGNRQNNRRQQQGQP